MSTWNPRANDLFLKALEIAAPDERRAFLDEACAGDAGLRSQVDCLIDAGLQAGSFLETPVIEQGQKETGPDTVATAQPPDAGGPALDFLAPSGHADHLGRLGHYEILSVVGQGGMGTVLRGFDEKLRRVVAIKVMSPQLASNGVARKRFIREAQAVAAVRNEHVVDIHAVEESSPVPYLVMEFISGESLQDRLDREGTLPVKEVLRIGLQMAQGLAAAHAQGIVHRDIKPSNILLENGVARVKITDFGLARTLDDAALTSSGLVAGTPQFMSPEQAQGEHVDHRADLFSLGSVLYAMCTGRPPFRASTTMGVLKRVCEETPTSIRELNPEAPDWLCDLIGKLHAKNPADRFSSAKELAEILALDLAQLHDPKPVQPRADQPPISVSVTTRPSSPSHRRRIVAAAILIAVAGVLLGEAIGITRLLQSSAKIGEPPPDLRAGPAQGALKDEFAKKEDDKSKAPPKWEGKPFVVLSSGGAKEFDSLAEAIDSCHDDDTIEIRGNGPFDCPPVAPDKPLQKRVAIRAGAGFWPVIRLEFAPVKHFAPWLGTESRLVLEGLDFRFGTSANYNPTAILSWGPCFIANCRFVDSSDRIRPLSGGLQQVRNSQFLSGGGALFNTKKLFLDNNVHACNAGIGGWLLTTEPMIPDQEVFIHDNTFCGYHGITHVLTGASKIALRRDVKKNIFQMSEPVLNASVGVDVENAQPALRQALGWREKKNVFGLDTRFAALKAVKIIKPGSPMLVDLPNRLNTIDEWEDFWGLTNTGSTRAAIKFQSGDILAKLAVNRALLLPEDFRLATGSAGKGAGRDGRDVGADIDLVGPGAAYERWKKTPAYQQWLEDSGQLKREKEPPDFALAIKMFNGVRAGPGGRASWAADSKSVVFAAPSQSGIKLYDLNARSVDTVLSDAAWDPTLSPDGSRLAFVKRPDKVNEIWVRDKVGVRRVATLKGQDAYPCWLDNDTVLWVDIGNIVWSLDVAAAAAAPVNRGQIGGAPLYPYPCVSRDGARVCYGQVGQIVISDNSMKPLKRFDFPGGREPKGFLGGWHPKGRHLGFGSYGCGDNYGLWLLDTHTGKTQRLVRGDVTLPSWSPDGKRLAFDHRPNGSPAEVWIIDAPDLPE